MKRHSELKRLDLRTRNKLRAILEQGGDEALSKISKIKGSLGKLQIASIESILASSAPIRSASSSNPFPKKPPFIDILRPAPFNDIPRLAQIVEDGLSRYREKISKQFCSLMDIDRTIIEGHLEDIEEGFENHVEAFGWSHAFLRRLVFARERHGQDSVRIENLLNAAGLSRSNIVVTSLVHAYAQEQNFLTIKRSTLNIPRRGANNRYTLALSRIPFEPIAQNSSDFALLLGEVIHCSLIDAVIFCRLNRHQLDAQRFPLLIKDIDVSSSKELVEGLLKIYDANDAESEYTFNKQSSVWLEYEIVRRYRSFIDCFYDGEDPSQKEIHPEILKEISLWLNNPTMAQLIGGKRVTTHDSSRLAELEKAGTVTRSAAFNYWLSATGGEVGFAREDILQLMGLTRDLQRTIPIVPIRNSVTIANDDVVKLILLLLLAKRSKNELDSFKLRRLLESLTMKNHDSSLVKLVESYQEPYPVISEYIYDITTEDFIAKLRLAPHLSDIPELRANLHEWMAQVTRNEYYIERARAVRVDHQLNRVRNEIDDHRIYVDPSRFWSWINDELMFDLNSALTATSAGKKTTAINCDEALLTSVLQQCYSAFCSNAVFGIASYIGRRIRHGTFHGHLYTSLINHIEGLSKFESLLRKPSIAARWDAWKQKYDSAIQEIIRERLHMHSKSKPNGLFQPEQYSQHKLDILGAAVQDINTIYTETKSTESLDKIITDYCWRLAENDLQNVQTYLKSLHGPIKQMKLLEELISTATVIDRQLAGEFKRDLVHSIDKKLSAMYNWFKRPSNVAPKASLALLYDAVVSEVKDSFPQFNPQTKDSPIGELELIGGAYHVLYDSFFVVLSNAAKYGDPNSPVEREFTLISEEGVKAKKVIIKIGSKIHPTKHPEEVRRDIDNRKSANFEDANLYERRSGIPKLMQLQQSRKEFAVNFLDVIDDKVQVEMSYAFAH